VTAGRASGGGAAGAGGVGAVGVGAVGVGAVAALDCGTNSTRLLVADRNGTPLDRLVRITRLGQGVDATSRLAPEAIARTAQVLSEYRAVMDARGVGPGDARLVATSAVRDAANRSELTEAAQRATGVTAEVLSGEEEGRLCYAGATAELEDPALIGGLAASDGPFLVLDIGGGSTELITGAATGPHTGGPDAAGATSPGAAGPHAGPGAAGPHAGPDTRGPAVSVVSLDLGCVRLTERYLRHDPPTAEELAQAEAAIHHQLAHARQTLPELEKAPYLVGVAGTLTTLAAMQQGLDTYDRDRVHHSVLTRPQVEELLGAMAAEPSRQRAQRPGLEEARAEVIVAGALILSATMADLGFESCLVSEADILDGLVASLIPDGPPSAH